MHLGSAVIVLAADSEATDFMSNTEVTRARVTLVGFCATSAL